MIPFLIWSVYLSFGDSLKSGQGQLHLWSTQTSDLSPLANLTQLTSLTLQGTQTSDLSPLASLTQLNTLILVDCPQIEDFSILKELSGISNIMLDISLKEKTYTLDINKKIHFVRFIVGNSLIF